MNVETLTGELRRTVQGKVLADAARIREYATDFGGIVRRTPRIVVEATCEHDVTETLRLAQEHALPVAVRGHGGSCNGQSLSDGGIVIANALDTPAAIDPDADGLVEVSARSRWQHVESALNRAGRAIPVLADYLPLSVGGTLAVGGYGPDSLAHGAQVDHVERLRVITPDGCARWCSASEHPELFRYSLAGQGRLGIIEKAVIRTMPYQSYSSVFCYRHRSLSEVVASLEWMTDWEQEWPDFFKALGSRGRFVSLYGFYSGRALPALCRRAPRCKTGPRLATDTASYRWICPRYRFVRSLAVASWIHWFGNRRRLWSDYLFDYAGLRRFAESLERRLWEDQFRGCLKAIYLLAIRQAPGPRLPLEAAGGIAAPVKFGIGLYCMIPPADDAALAAVAGTFRDSLEECVELGGRPYLYGWHHLDEAMLQKIYGAAYERLPELRREFDPDGVLGAGKLVA